MKTKVVLWGENGANEKILIGIELLEKDNKILIHTIPQRVATEELYQNMVNKWRESQDINWPEEKETIERPLSISDNLLPDDIKVERTDVINRAQAEWHFVVLSTKLYELYKEEVDELKAKVDKLEEYSEAQWQEIVEFWNKVSGHLKEHTLFKDHGATLKERTNILFDKLKEHKKSYYKQADQKSKEIADDLMAAIKKVSSKISEGLSKGPLFDELKEIQKKYYDAPMNKKDKNSVWDEINVAFKELKENKSGNRPEKEHRNSEENHILSRITGLTDAIKRMQKSVDYDQKEIEFQSKRIHLSEGKLELQLREAKMKMVETSLFSKKEKLDDMLKTKASLEEKLKTFESKKLKKEAEQKVKEKIAVDIEAQKEKFDDQSEKLENAAAEISESKGKKIKTAIGDIVSDVKDIAEDMVQSAKAVIEVAEQKIEEYAEVLENKADEVEDKAEIIKEKLEDKAEIIKEKLEDRAETIKENLGNKAESVSEDLEHTFEKVEDKIEDFVETFVEKAKEVIEDIKESFEKSDASDNSDLVQDDLPKEDEEGEIKEEKA
jgi:hypothetical protein